MQTDWRADSSSHVGDKNYNSRLGILSTSLEGASIEEALFEVLNIYIYLQNST